MNGRIKVNLGGKDVQLVFGMLANEELQKRSAIGEPGNLKLSIDLVYAGYCNAMILEGKAPEPYAVIAEWVDDLLMDDAEAISEVFKCYEDSKAGQYLIKSLAAADKEKAPAKQKKSREATNGTP